MSMLAERNRDRLGLLIPVGIGLAVAAVGLVWSQQRTRDQHREMQRQAEIHLTVLHGELEGHLASPRQAVANLACSPATIRALQTGDPQDLDQLNAMLDRYQSSFQVAVCYLIDSTGDTIASSNRNGSSSFVGRNYGFRPYFKQALTGYPSDYFARGVTSKKRGYYCSHPVLDPRGELLGVAVIKKDAEALGRSFRDRPGSYLVDPHGIVFLASDPNFLLRSLRPLTAEEIDGLQSSRQFGSGPFEPIFPGSLRSGELTRLDKERILVSRRFLSGTDWELVLLTPVPGLVAEQRLGFLLSGLVALLAGGAATMRERRRRHRSEQRRSAQALQASQRRYRAVFESAGAAMVIFGDNGVITLCNTKFEELSGFGRDRIEGQMRWSDFTDPEDRSRMEAYHAGRSRGSGKPPAEYEFAFQPRSGASRRVHVVVGLLPDSGERITSLTDITERIEAEEERRRLEAQVQYAQKLESLGILAGGIAHDFNNLLVGILGNVDLVAESLPGDSASREYLTDITRAAKRAAHLSQQMLAYSGRGRFLVKHLDLSELLQHMRPLLEASLPHDIDLQFELAELPPAIKADATQIRQVVTNLLDNAAEAIGGGPGEIRVRVSLEPFESEILSRSALEEKLAPGEYVCLEISDSGAGVTPETAERIFDPFYSTKFTGRGLGLAAVLGIIRGHRGAILLESEPGRGSRFRLLFPPLDKASTPISGTTLKVGAWEGHGTLLLVDDEESVRTTAGRILQRIGFEVVTAEDGLEAVELVRHDPDRFTVVILDVTMPGMSGREAWERIREIRPDLPVFFSSGYSPDQVLDPADGQAIAGFIQKPYRAATLITQLRSALG